MPEIVYILTNEAMPGLIKIGRTNGEVSERVRQLDTTPIPLPFECFYAAEVTDADRVEKVRNWLRSLQVRIDKQWPIRKRIG